MRSISAQLTNFDLFVRQSMASLVDQSIARARRVVAMLVLSRKSGQRVLIGGQITITVVKIGNGGVRIGIEAPAELPIIREELLDKFAVIGDTIADGLTASTNGNSGNSKNHYQNRLRGSFPPK
jgi:carbon storage regulator